LHSGFVRKQARQWWLRLLKTSEKRRKDALRVRWTGMACTPVQVDAAQAAMVSLADSSASN
jgi:hypothetical protein